MMNMGRCWGVAFVAVNVCLSMEGTLGSGAISSSEVRQMRIHHDASVAEEAHQGDRTHGQAHHRASSMRKEESVPAVVASVQVQPDASVIAPKVESTVDGSDIVCRNRPYEDSHGFGCDAYEGFRCEGGKTLTTVPPMAVSRCCACGGGLLEPAVEHVFQKMDAGDDFSACQWVDSTSGQVAWRCPDSMNFVMCSQDVDCATDLAQHVVGVFKQPTCQKLEGSAEGLCIDRAHDPLLHVWQVTPNEHATTFFLSKKDGFLRPQQVGLTSVADDSHFLTGPIAQAAPENISPCCCKPPHVAKQESTAPADEIADAVTAKLEGARNVLEAGLSTIGSSSTTCASVDCSKATCPHSPPVAVVKFTATSAHGVPLTGGVINQKLLHLRKHLGARATLADMQDQMAAEKAGAEKLSTNVALQEEYGCKAEGNEPCVSLQEGDMPFDGQEQAVVLSVAERHQPHIKDPKLAEIDETVAPATPECGKACVLMVKSRTLFLVDRSGSVANSQETVLQRLAPVYSDFCVGSDAPGGHVPIDKSCGMFIFDGTARLSPVAAFAKAGSSAAMDPSTALAAVKATKARDESTDLLGALKEAQGLLEENTGAVTKATAQTLVLVTDGEERAHREDATAVLTNLRESNIQVLVYFVRKAWRREAGLEAERFICKGLLGHSDEHCCGLDSATGCLGVDVHAPGASFTELAGHDTLSVDVGDNGAAFRSGDLPIFTALSQSAKVKPWKVLDKAALAGDKAAPQQASQAPLAESASDFSFASLPLFGRLEAYVSEQRAEVADYLERKAKHGAWVKTTTKKTAAAKVERDSKSSRMMDSWARLKRVYLQLYGAANYQMGFCSAYRAAEVMGGDERVAHIALQWAHGSIVTHDVLFSSKTFHSGHCTVDTVMAALGLHADADVATDADTRAQHSADKEPGVAVETVAAVETAEREGSSPASAPLAATSSAADSSAGSLVHSPSAAPASPSSPAGMPDEPFGGIVMSASGGGSARMAASASTTVASETKKAGKSTALFAGRPAGLALAMSFALAVTAELAR